MAGDFQFYLQRSYEKAFGQFDQDSWNHELGFTPNAPRIRKLYDYYRDTYLARPDLFLWAGLGRMAGGAVLGGLTTFVGMSGENFFSKTMVEIGKKIFEDLAWQHEAILDDDVNALTLVAQHQAKSPGQQDYKVAWEHILSGDAARIATGNKMLLENEQFTIIQPLYNKIINSSEGGFGGPMRALRSFTNSIHPYHRDFLLSLPTGQIVNPNDRWSWITETGGMWEKWAEKRGVPAAPIAMSKTVRAALVSLDMDKIIKRQWPVDDPSLLPPGAFDI